MRRKNAWKKLSIGKWPKRQGILPSASPVSNTVLQQQARTFHASNYENDIAFDIRGLRSTPKVKVQDPRHVIARVRCIRTTGMRTRAVDRDITLTATAVNTRDDVQRMGQELGFGTTLGRAWQLLHRFTPDCNGNQTMSRRFGGRGSKCGLTVQSASSLLCSVYSPSTPLILQGSVKHDCKACNFVCAGISGLFHTMTRISVHHSSLQHACARERQCQLHQIRCRTHTKG